MLDAIAAGRWLGLQDIDKDKLFLMGGSQGGWTVLRTFTDEPFMDQNAKGLYRAGFSLYPVCNSKGWKTDPTLGPYWGPVLVFTAGKDTATDPRKCPTRVFKEAASWIHYPDATHGWDTSNRGAHTPSVDGECGKALNIYNHFTVCRSNAATNDMHQKIKDFIQKLLI
jgi:dienelactone hydrolase